MAFIDYYKILGVDKTIPQKDVKRAYLKRAKQFHPDLHPDDPKAKAKFQALNEAYDVIGDQRSARSTTNMANSGNRPTKWAEVSAVRAATPSRVSISRALLRVAVPLEQAVSRRSSRASLAAARPSVGAAVSVVAASVRDLRSLKPR